MRCAALLLVLSLPLGACSSFWRWEPIDAPGGASAAKPRRAGAGEYQVRRGDTVYSIAFRHNLDYRQLAAWNGIGRDYLIYPGQILRLSPADAATSAARRDRPIVARPSAGAATAARQPASEPVVVKPAATPAAPLPSGPYRWRWPAQGPLLRDFSLPASKGLDIGGELGAPVHAAAPGRVVYSGSALKGYGELIIVKHDDTYLSAYGYNRRRLVKEGDVVRGGQQIGELGLGPENKPMLHFEIRRAGQPVNPTPLLPRR